MYTECGFCRLNLQAVVFINIGQKVYVLIIIFIKLNISLGINRTMFGKPWFEDYMLHLLSHNCNFNCIWSKVHISLPQRWAIERDFWNEKYNKIQIETVQCKAVEVADVWQGEDDVLHSILLLLPENVRGINCSINFIHDFSILQVV